MKEKSFNDTFPILRNEVYGSLRNSLKIGITPFGLYRKLILQIHVDFCWIRILSRPFHARERETSTSLAFTVAQFSGTSAAVSLRL